MLQQLPRLSPVSSWIAGARSESLWPMERHVAWCFTGWLGLPMDSAMRRYGKPKQISESKSLIYVQTCSNWIWMQPTTLNNTMCFIFLLFLYCSILNLDVSKNRGVYPPKWMVYNLWNTLFKMDDLGGETPLFLVQHPFRPTFHCDQTSFSRSKGAPPSHAGGPLSRGLPKKSCSKYTPKLCIYIYYNMHNMHNYIWIICIMYIIQVNWTQKGDSSWELRNYRMASPSWMSWQPSVPTSSDVHHNELTGVQCAPVPGVWNDFSKNMGDMFFF